MKQWIPGEPLTESDHELLQPLLDHAVVTGMTPTAASMKNAPMINAARRGVLQL